MISSTSCDPLLHFRQFTNKFLCRRVAFSSYGTYWLSFATIFIPGSGISDAYKADPAMQQHAMGLFHLAWMFLTFLFL